ncbi:MAG: hypothetical protein QM820_61665 [Minicystis sp.]
MSAFLADCDALNFTLVHLNLHNEVEALLNHCGGLIVTLDRVYRKEAQHGLRGSLDSLIKARLCEIVQHPSERALEKRQLKVLQQIDALARQRFRVTSDNDRGLLVEATLRGAPLFTEDGPLRKLAAERDHPTFDTLDVVALLHELQIVDDARRSDLLTAVAARMRDALRQNGHNADAAGCEALLRTRGGVRKRICPSDAAEASG